MSISYELISKFYSLLDIIYFRDNDRSPREAMLRSIPEGRARVLELCCGTGVNIGLIARHRPQAQIVGVDLSEPMLAIAERTLGSNALKNIELVKMDATKTGFNAACFDAVLISLVLHEIEDSLATGILAEARRVLKPGGQLIVIEWEAPERLSQRLLFGIIQRLEPRGFSGFLRTDMPQYFANHGFTIASEAHCDYSRVFTLAPITKTKSHH